MTIESIDLTEYRDRQSLYLNEKRVSDSYALYGGVDEQSLTRGTSRKTRGEIAGSVHAWLLGKMGFTVGREHSRNREEAAKRAISAHPVVMASLLEATQRAADKVLELQPGRPAPSQEEREPFDFVRCVSPQAVITREGEGVYNLGIPPDESPLPNEYPRQIVEDERNRQGRGAFSLWTTTVATPPFFVSILNPKSMDEDRVASLAGRSWSMGILGQIESIAEGKDKVVFITPWWIWDVENG
jgi:hypothetical protein